METKEVGNMMVLSKKLHVEIRLLTERHLRVKITIIKPKSDNPRLSNESQI